MLPLTAVTELLPWTNCGSVGGAGPYVVCATAMRQEEQRRPAAARAYSQAKGAVANHE